MKSRPAVSGTAAELRPRAVRILCAAPELLACALAGFALPLMVLLLVGQVVWPVVFPLGLIGAGVGIALCRDSPVPVTRDLARYTAIALLVVIVWSVVNAFFSAQDVFAHRDPATYNLLGRWLIDHASVHIPTHPEVFGSPAGYTDESGGFNDSAPGQLAAQGNHLMPALIAAVGRLFGTAGLLKANVAFGGLALFALFGLAHRLVGPRLALVVMCAFGVSLPMIYVSRDTFSEPLALLFLMAGLILLHRAIEYGRLGDYGLAGFVAGSSAMVRTDSDASLLALVIAAVVLLAGSPAGSRSAIARRVAMMLAAGLVPTVLGWVDVSRLSPAYYVDQRSEILLLALAGSALAVLGGLAVLLIWRPPVAGWLARVRWRPRSATAASVTIVAAFALLASRPLWMQGHKPFTPYLIQVQRQAHDAIDGNRNYNEQTLGWQALYFGWPTVLLAAAGYVLLVRRFLNQRDWALVGPLTMGLSMSLLYLWASKVTPDQVWASRRYVPVVMPMLLVAAAAALRGLRAGLGRRGRIGAALGALVLVGYPLVVTLPAFGIREEVPQLRQVRAICDRVGSDGAVVEVDLGAIYGYGQTIRSYCNVPSIGLMDATPAQLAAIRTSVLRQGRHLYVFATDATEIQFTAGHPSPAPYSTAVTTRWPSSLHTTPVGPTHETVRAFLGTVRDDGLVEPLSR
jgi:Dolichyl-phosphate-mannose-protein mannosyltransferase